MIPQDLGLRLIYPDEPGITLIHRGGRRCAYIQGASLYFRVGDEEDTDSWRDGTADHQFRLYLLYLDIGTETIQVGYTADGSAETVETVITKTNTGTWLPAMHDLAATARTAHALYAEFGSPDIRLYSSGELYVSTVALFDLDSQADVCWFADSNRTNILIADLIAANTIAANKLNVATLAAITANIGAATISDKLTLNGASGAITIGSTPPTDSSHGTGVWIDRTGIYVLSSDVVVARLDRQAVCQNPADWTTTSNFPTLDGVDNFLINIAANEVWAVDAYFKAGITGTNGFCVGLLGPAGASADYIQSIGPRNIVNAETMYSLMGLGSTSQSYLYGIGGAGPVEIHALVTNGANAGAIQVAACRDASAGTVTVYDQGYLIGRRVG